jgi:hypothetical protein
MLVGCFGKMTPGKMEWVQPHSDAPRAGNVYLIRGLIGLFSFGIDEFGETINQNGVRAHVFQQDQNTKIAKAVVESYRGVKNPEPLIIVGHSLGADDAIMIAREAKKAGIWVDMIVTMDAVNPLEVPDNVGVVYNYYQPSIFDKMGMLRGVPLTLEAGNTRTVLHNLNIRGERKDLLEPDTNHINIEKNKNIHRESLAHILEVCIPRDQWVAKRGKTVLANGQVAGAVTDDRGAGR